MNTPKVEAKADTKSPAKGDAKPDAKPAVSADPLGDLAKAKSAPAVAEVFNYFVQVGAFRTADDAESHRAKLSLSGIETKVSEREQSGRMVFRVRAGPFDSKEEAERSKEKLSKAGLETALVRVPR
jgi:cell division protein FtsN